MGGINEMGFISIQVLAGVGGKSFKFKYTGWVKRAFLGWNFLQN